MSEAPFIVGDRVWNNGNKDRKVIGIVTKVIDRTWCEVLWSDGEGYAYNGTIQRDGTVVYTKSPDHRIVRVKLSVRVPAPVISDRHTPMSEA